MGTGKDERERMNGRKGNGGIGGGKVPEEGTGRREPGGGNLEEGTGKGGPETRIRKDGRP